METIATLPGGWDLAHAIRLGDQAVRRVGADSEALSGFQVDSPCSCRAIFELAPVAMLQSREIEAFVSESKFRPGGYPEGRRIPEWGLASRLGRVSRREASARLYRPHLRTDPDRAG